MSKIDEILQELNKDKKFTVPAFKLSDQDVPCRVTDWVSTRNMAVDAITGGGFPVRRITEIYGDNSTGKTLLAVLGAIEAQEQGALVVYCDIEVALGLDRMIDLGIDPENFIYIAPNTIDDILKALDKFMQLRKKYDDYPYLYFVFDSVAALATQDELSKSDWESKDYPRAAAYMSQAMRRLKNDIPLNDVCLVLINQTRQKLGVFYGDGATTYGGMAVGFYSSLRLELQNTSKIKDKNTGKIIGVNTKVTCVKNKLAAPYKSVLLPVYYDSTEIVDEADSVLNLMNDHNIISQSGGWYTILLNGEEHKFQRSKFPELFFDKFNDIEDLIFEEFGIDIK